MSNDWSSRTFNAILSRRHFAASFFGSGGSTPRSLLLAYLRADMHTSAFACLLASSAALFGITTALRYLLDFFFAGFFGQSQNRALRKEVRGVGADMGGEHCSASTQSFFLCHFRTFPSLCVSVEESGISDSDSLFVYWRCWRLSLLLVFSEVCFWFSASSSFGFFLWADDDGLDWSEPLYND